VILASTFGLFVTTAEAHTDDYFSGPAWIDPTIEYYRASDGAAWPSCPPNCWWNDTLSYGDQRWSQQSTTDDFFVRAGIGASRSGQLHQLRQRGQRGQAVVARRTRGISRRSGRLPYGGRGREIQHGLCTDEDWYHTTGNDGVNNTVSAYGVATHEFGHAAGFKNHFPDNDAGVCSFVALADVQTMCTGFDDLDDFWNWNTLETHDKHEFSAEYPP
jgi:hypothetical protein